MKRKNTKISYSKQFINNQDIKAVINVLKSDYLTQGPIIKKFESKLSNYCKSKYAVIFSSGTGALHGACYAAGINQGDEVITTPMTFTASANCILYCRGIPIFADIKQNIPLIDPKKILNKITKKTKAIIPVDYAGIPADYDEINNIARNNNLIVIADACHSMGATYKGKRVGSLTHMSVLSFHPVKTITTGEGGAVLTNNYKLYQKLLLFRSHGITKNPKKMFFKNIGSWYYEMQDIGYNYRMSDIQAILGISQLKRINIFLKKREQIANFYSNKFNKQNKFSYLKIPFDRTSSWHLFPILLNDKYLNKKKEIVKNLHKKGIMVQVHYIPIHLHYYYQKKFGYKIGDFPNSEKFYNQEISIPIYPSLNKINQIKIIQTLCKLIN